MENDGEHFVFLIEEGCFGRGEEHPRGLNIEYFIDGVKYLRVFESDEYNWLGYISP